MIWVGVIIGIVVTLVVIVGLLVWCVSKFHL